MNLDWCFVVVWPQRQTFVGILLQQSKSESARADVRRLEYVHIHVIYRVNQAEYVMRICVAASHEYVNVYSTRRDEPPCTCTSGRARLALFLILGVG